MKTQYGRAGFSTKFLWYKKGKNELVALLMGFLILLIISVFILGLSTYDMRFIIVILGVAPLIFYDILRRFQKLHKLSKRSIKGAKGEEEVGRILSKLPETYVVFHDIKSPYGNIDHVVFDGLNNIVFLIETKAYNGNVLFYSGGVPYINGKPLRKDILGQIQYNAVWLKEKLIKELSSKNVTLIPVIIFTNARVETVKVVKGDLEVFITNKNYLLKLLMEYSERYSKPDVETSHKIHSTLLHLWKTECYNYKPKGA